MRQLEHNVRVHGHAFFLEFPGPGAMNNVSNIDWTDQQGFRQGFAVTFRGKAGRHNFFHASVPFVDGLSLYNPYLPGQRFAESGATVTSVGLTFVTAGPARIVHLALFDGPNREIVADRRPSIDIVSGRPIPFTMPVLIALGITVGVEFDSDDATIAFHGARVTVRTTFFEESDR